MCVCVVVAAVGLHLSTLMHSRCNCLSFSYCKKQEHMQQVTSCLVADEVLGASREHINSVTEPQGLEQRSQNMPAPTGILQ